MASHGNSFTFLRLVFALAVVFSHSFILGGFGPDPLAIATGGKIQIGTIAVVCFFIISGFLITGSVLRQKSIWRFALHRGARILPGFWMVQLLTVFALAPVIMLIHHGDQLDYWDTLVVGPNSAISYLGRNAGLGMLQYPITDLFYRNPGNSAVNGSLWSLAPEVTCYFYLGLLAVIGGLRWKFTGPVLFLIVYGLHIGAASHPELLSVVARRLEMVWISHFQQAPFRSVFLAFLAGMTCYQFRDRLVWKGWLAVCAGVALVAACWAQGFEMVWPIALPYLLLYLAFRLPFQRVEDYGDFSYGIYIYAFPIQQCLTLAGLPRFGFFPYLASSMILSVVAGVASWRWIEEPVLKWARNVGRQPVVEPQASPAVALPLRPVKEG